MTEATRLTMRLPVRLTTSELTLRGNEHRMTLDRLDSLEARLKATREEIKFATEHANFRERELRNILNTSSETRDVECEESPDYNDRQWLTRRLDTFERVQSRPMSEKELQIQIKDFASPSKPLDLFDAQDVAQERHSRKAPKVVTDLAGELLDPDWIAIAADGSRIEVTMNQVEAWRKGLLYEIEGTKIVDVRNVALSTENPNEPTDPIDEPVKLTLVGKPKRKPKERKAPKGDSSPNVPDFGTPDAPVVYDTEEDD